MTRVLLSLHLDGIARVKFCQSFREALYTSAAVQLLHFPPLIYAFFVFPDVALRNTWRL